MNNGFQTLSKQEQIIMAKNLAIAFSEHDNFMYLIPHQQKRLKASSMLFRFMTKVMNRYGYIYVVYDNQLPIGYITFMDDSKASMNARTVLCSNAVWYVIRFWFQLSFQERKRYKAYLKQYSTLKHTKKNMIHLYYTGILPQYKGKGIMKHAMNEALLHFQQQGYDGVCLETSDASNVGLYEHLGYAITQRVQTNNERQEIFFFEKEF